jgi:hypothetical protein
MHPLKAFLTHLSGYDGNGGGGGIVAQSDTEEHLLPLY